MVNEYEERDWGLLVAVLAVAVVLLMLLVLLLDQPEEQKGRWRRHQQQTWKKLKAAAAAVVFVFPKSNLSSGVRPPLDWPRGHTGGGTGGIQEGIIG